MTRETIHYVGRDGRGRAWVRRQVSKRHLHHGRDMYQVVIELLPATLSTEPAGPYYVGPMLTASVELGADLGQITRNLVEQMRKAGL